MATATSPSNRLYHGEVTTFLEAMDLVQKECAIEIRNNRIYCGPDEDLSDLDASLKAYSAAAQGAINIYLQHVRAAEEAAIAEIKQRAVTSNDDDLRIIAEALESGDYTPLAL